MKKMTEQERRWKEYSSKKELKRFDTILKEIFSEAIGTIYYLATGKKIGKKVRVISAEISLVKTFLPDILVEAGSKIIQIEIQAQQDKTLSRRMFRYYYAIVEKYKIKVNPMPIQVDIRKTFLYKLGEREGEKRGLQKGVILGIVQSKFGSSKAKQFKNFLEKVDDINHLKKIKTEAIRAKTWEDFIKFVQNSKISNPKNSKKN
jgi:hypothetical protein